MKKWAERYQSKFRFASMGLNFILLAVAVSLMLNEEYKRACEWFIFSIICFVIDFTLDAFNKFVDNLPEEEE